MTDRYRIAAMANQIARNLAIRGDAVAVDAMTTHIRDFWDPRMIGHFLADDGETLDPIAVRVRDRLRAEAQGMGAAAVAATPE